MLEGNFRGKHLPEKLLQKMGTIWVKIEIVLFFVKCSWARNLINWDVFAQQLRKLQKYLIWRSLSIFVGVYTDCATAVAAAAVDITI